MAGPGHAPDDHVERAGDDHTGHASGEHAGRAGDGRAQPVGDERTVRDLLERLQAAYAARDVEGLDAFMELFAEGEEPEMIGTEAAERGDFDWGRGRHGVRAITEWDWRHWFDVRFRLDDARVTVRGDVAWVTVPVTLVQTELSREGARRFVEESVLPDLRRVLDDEYLAPGARLGEAAARATARLRELAAPPGDRRPLTFSAVLVRDGGVWRFHTTHWALAAL